MGGIIASSQQNEYYDADSLKQIAGDDFDQNIFDQYSKISDSGKRVVEYQDLVEFGFIGKEDLINHQHSDCDQSARTLSSELTTNLPVSNPTQRKFNDGKSITNYPLIVDDEIWLSTPSIESSELSATTANRVDIVSQHSQQNPPNNSATNQHIIQLATDSKQLGNFGGDSIAHDLLVSSLTAVTALPSHRISQLSRQNSNKSGNSMVLNGNKTRRCAEGHPLELLCNEVQFEAVTKGTDGPVCSFCNEDDRTDCPFYYCPTCSQLQCHYCAVGCSGEPEDFADHTQFDDSEMPNAGCDDDMSEN